MRAADRHVDGVEPAADVPHGTEGGYSNHGCRCDRCTTAARVSQQARRDRKRVEAGLPVYGGQGKPWQHGTTTGYGRHGCRCEQCTAANTEMTTSYTRRRRDAVRAGTVPADSITHGRSGYARGCRCEVCCDKNGAYRRQRRDQGLDPETRKPPRPSA